MFNFNLWRALKRRMPTNAEYDGKNQHNICLAGFYMLYKTPEKR